jgi:hypothetical protein
MNGKRCSGLGHGVKDMGEVEIVNDPSRWVSSGESRPVRSEQYSA